MENTKLTDTEKEMLADFDREIYNAQQQKQGACRFMLKTRGLTGEKYQIVDGEFVEQK